MIPDSCQHSIKYFVEIQQQNQLLTDSLLQQQILMQNGIEGIPVPYMYVNDKIVTFLMIAIFLLVARSFSSKLYINGLCKVLFNFNISRNHLYNNTFLINSIRTFVLLLCTSVLIGFSMYIHNVETFTLAYVKFAKEILLLLCILVVAISMFLKMIPYFSINWIFFEKEKRREWVGIYTSAYILLGVLFFPIVIAKFFIDYPYELFIKMLFISYLLTRIILFYRCFKNFFDNYYSILQLFLYFCALEIIPDIFIYKGVMFFSDLMISKF